MAWPLLSYCCRCALSSPNRSAASGLAVLTCGVYAERAGTECGKQQHAASHRDVLHEKQLGYELLVSRYRPVGVEHHTDNDGEQAPEPTDEANLAPYNQGDDAQQFESATYPGKQDRKST